MNNTQLKSFINNFNYPEPSWDDLPAGFPFCDTKNLSPQEQGLFSAIVLIWYANHGGRAALIKRLSQSMMLLLIMIVSGVLLRNIIVSNMFERAISVNAATVSATLRTIDNVENSEFELPPSRILESTVSGLLRKETRNKTQ